MSSKKKEDRSDWVAVEPEFASAATTAIRKAQTAYAFFQAAVTSEVKEQIIRETGKFDIALFGRAVRDRWNSLSPQDQQPYVDQAHRDAARFAQESHQADVLAMQRAEKLRCERDQLFVEDSSDMILDGTRTTRNKLEKKRKKKTKTGSGDESSGSDTTNSGTRPPKKMPRPISQKQQEYIAAKKQEKMEKEQYISGRQADLRKERAEQARRRLEYLLKQSNIFSHFGSVKQDALKYGIKSAASSTQAGTAADGALDGSLGSERGSSSRRSADGKPSEEDELDALEEADEHDAIFLTKQPSTLGHGQMRDYQ